MESKASFTLIELLIVIGILSVLVVTILITLNPSEAQKKARDTKRMKDLANIQAIIEQYLADGNPPACVGTYNGLSGCQGYTFGSIQSQPCASSWIKNNTDGSSVNLCNYSKTIPLDPLNGQRASYICGTDIGNPQVCQGDIQFQYYIVGSGSDYKIGGRQESKSNASNTFNDGGRYNAWIEIASNSNAMQTLW